MYLPADRVDRVEPPVPVVVWVEEDDLRHDSERDDVLDPALKVLPEDRVRAREVPA